MCNYPHCILANIDGENYCSEHFVDYSKKTKRLSVQEMQNRLKEMAMKAPKHKDSLEYGIQEAFF